MVLLSVHCILFAEVTIIVPNAPPGAHVVKVTVIGQGESRYEDEFTYTVQPEIVAMEPETGAMGGQIINTHKKKNISEFKLLYTSNISIYQDMSRFSWKLTL